MRYLLLTLALLSPFASGVSSRAHADDAMEAQRCIMRCASSTGTKQPAYDQCIKSKCDVGSAPEPKSTPSWRSELRTASQASVSLLSIDKRHRMDVGCGAFNDSGLSYSVYFEKTGKKSRIKAGPGVIFSDHRMFKVELGGADGGWVASNTRVGNVAAMTVEAVQAFASASEVLLMSGTIDVEPAATFRPKANSKEYKSFLQACAALGKRSGAVGTEKATADRASIAPTEQLSQAASDVTGSADNIDGVALNRGGDEIGGFDLIKRAADAGDTAALANYGILLRDGVGTPKDIKKGNAALKAAAEAGDPFGILGWGLSHQNGIGVMQSSKKAYEIWAPAFDTLAGPEAKFYAAQWMGFPESVDKSSRSYELCRAAMDQGHRPAFFYCEDFGPNSADWRKKLDLIESAVQMSPWWRGTGAEKIYVKEFFWDTDDTLRWVLGYSAPVFDQELNMDLYARVTELGFSVSVEE